MRLTAKVRVYIGIMRLHNTVLDNWTRVRCVLKYNPGLSDKL